MRELVTVILFFIGGISAVEASEVSATQEIDALIEANLARNDLKPNAAIDDATFLRRAYLNIIGRIPTIEEAEAFGRKTAPDPRSELIDELLASDGYVSHFYNFWADILRMRDGGPSSNAFINYQLWLKKALRDNMAYDDFVIALVSARGKSWENGASGYYHRDRGMPLDNMSNTARIFLGTRLECAQCHDHPFDKWTQMDYFKMAAFSYSIDARDVYTFNPLRIESGEHLKQRYRDAFAEAVGLENFPFLTPDRVEIHIEKHSQNPRDPWLGEGKNAIGADEFRTLAAKGWEGAKEAYELQKAAYWAGVKMYRPLLNFSVVDKERELELPHDYQYDDAKPHDVVQPATMFGDEIDIASLDENKVDAYAKWIASSDNPRFTRVIANRLWKKAFGVGLIEPVDEFTDHTVASSPELLDSLEKLMVDLDYDMRAYLAVLFKTKAWQRAVFAEEFYPGMEFHFSGPALQRLSAEQIWDSMVALCIPDAERYRPLLKNQLASIEREKLTWTSLEGRSFDDYLQMIITLGPIVMQQRNEEARISQEMAQARGDQARIDALRTELKAINKKTDAIVTEIGLKDLHKARKGDQLLGDMLGLSEAGMSMMQPGKAGSAAVFTSLPEITLPAMPEGLDKNQQREWTKRQKNDLRIFKGLVAKMARASELETPAPRGHFLRDFGQSDREVIENASSHASVPQALNLLNGPMIEALTNRFAVFGRRLDAADSEQEKIRIIFQAMLTREPTDSEQAIARSEIAQYGDVGYDGLVWALLNTRQFLFVQ
jgi:hypothetical protein